MALGLAVETKMKFSDHSGEDVGLEELWSILTTHGVLELFHEQLGTNLLAPPKKTNKQTIKKTRKWVGGLLRCS